MNFQQLVWRNVTRNPRVYLSYFLSSLFSVTIFFVASLLYFHPSLQGEYLAGNTRWTVLTLYTSINHLFGLTLLIIAILALAFSGSMFRLFLKERSTTFTLYLMLGMTKRDLKKMLAWENGLIGITSITGGIGLGLILSKLALLIGENILSLDFTLIFYWPLKAIVLTYGVYLVVFSLIAVGTLGPLKSRQANMSLNIQVVTNKEPTSSLFLSILGPVLLLLSYSAFLIIGNTYTWGWGELQLRDHSLSGLLFILGTSLTLVLGLFLVLNQTTVRLAQFFRKQPWAIKGNNFMVMSHLADRLKINSGLYFLITVTSILCFLTISGTLLLSKVALYGTDRENSLAYTYRTYNIHNQADLKFHQDNITYITQAIQAEGYNVRVNTLDDSVYLILQSNRYIPKFYEDEVDLSYFDQHLAGDKKILYLVPLSEYNQMAKFNKKAPLTLKSAREIVILSPQQRPPQEIFSGKVLYGEGEGVHLDNVPFRFVKGHYGAGRNLMNISVVSDSYFDEIKAMEQPESAPTKKNEADQGQETLTFPFQIIHFRQWRKAPQVDKRVRTFLNERQEQLEASLEKADISDPLSSDVTFFDYTSSYQTYSQKKQESGSTLLISVLIASVYIVFSTCILYFRIFGELRQDRRQHKTLHVLGVPAKNRHRLITIEMWVMFFLPSSLSLLSYAIIIISAQRLFAVSLSLTMAQLILGSVLFEIFFFLYARTRYIRQIDYYLEKTAST